MSWIAFYLFCILSEIFLKIHGGNIPLKSSRHFSSEWIPTETADCKFTVRNMIEFCINL